jgi:3(or 17)beta-hydroxysteroid dehydrogenase
VVASRRARSPHELLGHFVQIGDSRRMSSGRRVEGKVAIVTGAASGIGRACAEHLAREGARVIVTDRDGDGAVRVADALGAPHVGRTLDVTDEAAWTAVVDETVAAAGRLDVLVNNAGIGVVGDIERATLADFRRQYAVNVEGVFLGCRAAIAAMKRTGGGSIVNISSVAGIVADPNLAGYCASKGAVRMLSKSIALHGARRSVGVRCNSVHPSFIDTPMVADLAQAMGGTDEVRARLEKASPMGRLGHVDDVALMVLYLASDESKFVTGAELVVDGGLTAR